MAESDHPQGSDAGIDQEVHANIEEAIATNVETIASTNRKIAGGRDRRTATIALPELREVEPSIFFSDVFLSVANLDHSYAN
ncbi:MAG: hypothetical protein M1821_002627 [Bathelium mastoideum]|nr:MAG: hypothetical protein M1821_002627 [Bathelium mastoideum]